MRQTRACGELFECANANSTNALGAATRTFRILPPARSDVPPEPRLRVPARRSRSNTPRLYEARLEAQGPDGGLGRESLSPK